MLLASDHYGPLTVWVQVQCCLPFRWSQENEVRLSYHPLRQSSVAPQALGGGGGVLLLHKKQRIFCKGQKTARTGSHPAGGLSSCGHLKQPPWNHGLAIQGDWNRFTMWTSVTLHPSATTSAHCGKKWPCQSSVTEERFIGLVTFFSLDIIYIYSPNQE